MARLHATRVAESRSFGSTVNVLKFVFWPQLANHVPLISSSAETGACFSISTSGLSFFATLVEVFARTLGHAGAFVSAPSKFISSLTDVLLSFAAVVRLHNVTEKPGPFKDVSKGPE